MSRSKTRNDFFSSRSEEKHFLWRWCMCHYSFAKHFFVLFLHIKRVLKKFLHNAARAFSSPSRCFQFSRQILILFRCLWYCGKKQSNVVKHGLYSCRRYAALQWSKCCATNWATSPSARFALVIEYVSSIHQWANSRCWISQSERTLCFGYHRIWLCVNLISY